jgi:hypothetical protein
MHAAVFDLLQLQWQVFKLHPRMAALLQWQVLKLLHWVKDEQNMQQQQQQQQQSKMYARGALQALAGKKTNNLFQTVSYLLTIEFHKYFLCIIQ